MTEVASDATTQEETGGVVTGEMGVGVDVDRRDIVRGFRLTVTPATNNRTRVSLFELYGTPTKALQVSVVPPQSLHRVLPHILQTLAKNGYKRTQLNKKETVELDEESGVKLAVILIASATKVKMGRIDAMAETVQHMSVEEVFYWYSKAMGPNRSRVRKALRIFLAEE